MKIFDFLTAKPSELARPIVTIGVFDGVHKGHQALFKCVNQTAIEQQGSSVVITFNPHPLEVLKKRKPPFITSFEKRLELFERHHLQGCWVIHFTREIAAISPQDFVEEHLLKRLQIRGIIVGENFRFGNLGAGDSHFIESMGKKHSFFVKIVPCLQENTTISSTYIRKSIETDDFATARSMLGRPFSVMGKVVQGRQQGRVLGFPTANLELSHDLELSEGVFSGATQLQGVLYPSLISVGKTPTFGEHLPRKTEVYINGFQGDLYGQQIETYVFEKIRGQITFSGVEDLCAQMQSDKSWLLQKFSAYTVAHSNYEQQLFAKVSDFPQNPLP